MGWRSLPPPYDAKKPLWSKLPPVGARVGGRTPAETIQVIGNPKKMPKEVRVDLGVTDIIIKGGAKPTIQFTGHGMKTDIGTRIPGPETGLSLGSEYGGSLSEAQGLSLDDEPTGIPELALNAPPRRSEVGGGEIEAKTKLVKTSKTGAKSRIVAASPAESEVLGQISSAIEAESAQEIAKAKMVSQLEGAELEEPEEESITESQAPKTRIGLSKKITRGRKPLTNYEYMTTLKGFDPYTFKGA